MPTASVQDYLKTIYHLQQVSEGSIRTKEIADRLEIASPSVTNMLKSLASDGLLTYVPYQGVTLTTAGSREALKTIRKHRLIEVFLMNTLGFTWDEVHREAEALEHAVSDRLANRLDAFLGFPQTDPHGDPIPRADGSIRRPDGVALSQLPKKTGATLVRVLEQTSEILRYLADNALTPGAHVTVLREEPFDGALTVQVGKDTVAISRSLAHRIIVSPETAKKPTG